MTLDVPHKVQVQLEDNHEGLLGSLQSQRIKSTNIKEIDGGVRYVFNASYLGALTFQGRRQGLENIMQLNVAAGQCAEVLNCLDPEVQLNPAIKPRSKRYDLQARISSPMLFKATRKSRAQAMMTSMRFDLFDPNAHKKDDQSHVEIYADYQTGISLSVEQPDNHVSSLSYKPEEPTVYLEGSSRSMEHNLILMAGLVVLTKSDHLELARAS